MFLLVLAARASAFKAQFLHGPIHKKSWKNSTYDIAALARFV